MFNIVERVVVSPDTKLEVAEEATERLDFANTRCRVVVDYPLNCQCAVGINPKRELA